MKRIEKYLIGLLAVSPLLGNPTNPTIVRGDVVFQDTTDNHCIVHGSDQAIINWQKFSIDKHEIIQFVLPTSKSSILNRVTGQLPSHIFGQLQANGHVVIVNPSGIFIGSGAIVNTAGFIASSLDILDDDFVSGKMHFKGDSTGSVINHGIIKASDGDALLIGYQVINDGTLEAVQGVAGIGAGYEILIQPIGEERIYIKSTSGVASQQTGVTHRGFIDALQAELKADGNLYSLAIAVDGKISASHLTRKDGKIFITASEGMTTIQGQLDAPSGEIHIHSKYIDLVSGAQLDVSSESQGGKIALGTEPHSAYNVRVHGDASLKADAHVKGNGGEIYIFADNATLFYGSASAQGGTESGDGGFIEISGKQFIDLQGPVSTFSPQGKSGTFFIDPFDLTIDDGVANNALVTLAPPLDMIVASNGAASNITPATINGYLAANDTVQIQTYGASPQGTMAGNIKIQSTIGTPTFTFAAASPFGQTLFLQAAGKLQVLTGVTFTNGGSFSFESNYDIDVNAPIQVKGLFAGSQPFIFLTSDIGNINVNSNILMEEGNITLTASSSGPPGSFFTGGNIIVQSTGNTPTLVGITQATQPGFVFLSGNGNVEIGTNQLNNDVEIFSVNGGVTLGAANDIIVMGANGYHAQVGVNYDTAQTFAGHPSAINCNITVVPATGDLYVLGDTIGGGPGLGYAQIGNSGGSTLMFPSNLSMETGITITAFQGTFVQGGLSGSYAQIGSTPCINALTTMIMDPSVIAIAGPLIVSGGSGSGAFGLIGHGGLRTTRSTTYQGLMFLNVIAENIALKGGGASNTFAAIGIVGRPEVDFNTPLNLSVVAQGATSLVSGPTRTNIDLTASSNVNNSGALIGIFLYDSAGLGTITSPSLHNISVAIAQSGGYINLTGNAAAGTSPAAIGIDHNIIKQFAIGSTLSVTASDIFTSAISGITVDGTNGSAFIQDGRDGAIGTSTQIQADDFIHFKKGDIASLGTVLALAGNNISLTNNSHITGPGGLTLVTDNNYPFSPEIFFNGIVIDATSSLQTTTPNGPPIYIYTARFSQNTFGGVNNINGVTFSGTRFVNDPRNQYCTYYPNGTATYPYTVFYKECNLLNPPPIPGSTPNGFIPIITYLGFEFQPFVLDEEDLYWEPGYYIAYEQQASLHRPLWQLFHFRTGLNERLSYRDNLVYDSFTFGEKEKFFLHKKKYLYYKGYL
jgi:filamentous hemagglutinin family protein